MTWILWVIVGLLALGTVLNITLIGKDRGPATPGVTAVSTLVNAGIIWAIIAVGIYG